MANSDVEISDSERWSLAGFGERLRFRPRLILAIVLLLAAGVAARKLWENLHDRVASSPRYQLTAEKIHLTPESPPVWIRSDVKSEVLRDSRLIGSVTLLDDTSEIRQRMVDAFEIHPWIRSVNRIEFTSPSHIKVELEYREPVAVTEVEGAGQVDLLPVDIDGVRLPDGDLTAVEKSYLPRIADIEARPLVGDSWTDLRVVGAVRLAARLRGVWERFQLLDIVPSEYPEVQRGHKYFAYEIRSNGGTVILWGSAPELGPPGESLFEDKLARLQRFVSLHGPLGSIDSPKIIDVRETLQVAEKSSLKK